MVELPVLDRRHRRRLLRTMRRTELTLLMAATFQVAIVNCRFVTTDFMPPRKERAPPVEKVFKKLVTAREIKRNHHLSCFDEDDTSSRQSKRTRTVKKGRVDNGGSQCHKNLILVVR